MSLSMGREVENQHGNVSIKLHTKEKSLKACSATTILDKYECYKFPSSNLPGVNHQFIEGKSTSMTARHPRSHVFYFNLKDTKSTSYSFKAKGWS